VANTLRRTGNIEAGSDAYGRALEHLIFLELRAYLDYHRLDAPLTYWRSRSRFEVDFVVGDRVAIEVKAKPRVSARDYKGLRGKAKDLPPYGGKPVHQHPPVPNRPHGVQH
jgi:predicted AAA+ superfamily ATPase